LPPVLRKIIELTAPGRDFNLAAPVIPAWEEIYPDIAPHAAVLQALMTPAPSPESYYQNLLAAARAMGLKEPQLLLGLLWHAPLGDVRERSQGWQYLQQLLNGGGLAGRPQEQGPRDDGPGQSRVPQGRLRAMAEQPMPAGDFHHSSSPGEEDHSSRAFSGHTAISLAWAAEEPFGERRKSGAPHQDKSESDSNWQEFVRTSQEKLIVERSRYEAMIYELGKLKVWQEICKQERREKKSLNLKLEAQLAREVDYLRYLLKKNA
jgi:hypothetical protein